MRAASSASRLAADAVPVTIEPVRVRVGHIPANLEASPLDLAAIEIGRSDRNRIARFVMPLRTCSRSPSVARRLPGMGYPATESLPHACGLHERIDGFGVERLISAC